MKSRGSEYAEYGVDVFMLADAYAAMRNECELPIDRHGDVRFFTLWYRFRKFASLHKRLAEERPEMRLPPFPAASILQYMDTAFLESRRRKLQGYCSCPRAPALLNSFAPLT